MHHDLDSRRFLHLPSPEAGYARYFAGELKNDDVVLLVAQRTSGAEANAIVGYAYGRLEPRSYNELLDACGKLHDVYVDEQARGNGLGEQLVVEMVRRLGAKGAPACSCSRRSRTRPPSIYSRNSASARRCWR